MKKKFLKSLKYLFIDIGALVIIDVGWALMTQFFYEYNSPKFGYSKLSINQVSTIGINTFNAIVLAIFVAQVVWIITKNKYKKESKGWKSFDIITTEIDAFSVAWAFYDLCYGLSIPLPFSILFIVCSFLILVARICRGI